MSEELTDEELERKLAATPISTLIIGGQRHGEFVGVPMGMRDGDVFRIRNGILFPDQLVNYENVQIPVMTYIVRTLIRINSVIHRKVLVLEGYKGDWVNEADELLFGDE